MTSAKGNTAATVLATLAVVQLSLLADGPETGKAGFVAIGDDLSGVRVGDGGEASSPLIDFQLVLVFDPECAHSRRVAPKWAGFLKDADRPGSVVAVAPGSLAAAARHAEAYGWQVPVATPDRFRPGSRDHALVSRTPWVFALQDGRVVAQGHGDELTEVVAALSSSTGASRAARPRLATANLP
ncbi:MAG: hypothetical protein OXN18_16060 [Gemmatimonadota bacterium]|nr:hypothetical protein [Gemmatimonadota bacterium]